LANRGELWNAAANVDTSNSCEGNMPNKSAKDMDDLEIVAETINDKSLRNKVREIAFYQMRKSEEDFKACKITSAQWRRRQFMTSEKIIDLVTDEIIKVLDKEKT
jgi:hypothetical protein